MDPRRIDALREIASRYGEARLIVVFGSVARGEAAPWSDCDVGVSGLETWRGLELAGELATVLAREVHLVDLDHASDWLRHEVARDAIVLAEAEPGITWPCFVARALTAYFDLAPLIALCAEGARRHLREVHRG